MKYFSIAFYLILNGLFNSCNNSHGVIYFNVMIDNKMSIIKKTFDVNRNLVTEEVLNKDSINDGYYKKWNIGKLQLSGTYIEGKKEGKWFYMDLGGDTIKIENWFSGKKFGNQYEFFSPIHAKDVPRIYKYTFFSLDEKELSSFQFDVNHNLIKYTGLPLYTAYNRTSLKKDETFELICFWGNPPDLRFKLTVEETNNKEAILRKELNNNDKNYEVLDFANRIVFEKIYLTKGSYKWKLFLTIIDKGNHEIIKDSSTIDINVK